MKIRLLFFALFFSVIFCVAKANNGVECNNPKPDLEGGVTDVNSKKPINNVNVTAVLHESKETYKSITDSNGNYSFGNIKGGYYKLTFQKEGYRKITKEKVFLREDDNNQLNIEMAAHSDFQIIPGILILDFD